MFKLALIAAGGAVGSLARYGVASAAARIAGGTFPLGTLLVNVSDCLLIGLVAGFVAGGAQLRDEYRLGLTVGVLGGYTTFSAFGLETFRLADAGQWRWAALNVFLSCVLGLAAVWLGYRVAD